MRENLSDMIDRWTTERAETRAAKITKDERADQERASRAGLGIDPAWLAARERVQRVQWIEGE